MTGENVNPIPNILTMIRLIAGLIMFLLLAAVAGGIPLISPMATSEFQFPLMRWAFYAYLIAALTDFLDGYLARKLNAESKWGAILDPIADKILVCGTILGLFAITPGDPIFAVPAALILFREFAVSALREAAGARGISVPVSLAGKFKTGLQLVALGALLLAQSWSAFDFPPEYAEYAFLSANVLLWLAAASSIWSAVGYFAAARKDL